MLTMRFHASAPLKVRTTKAGFALILGGFATVRGDINDRKQRIAAK